MPVSRQQGNHSGCGCVTVASTGPVVWGDLQDLHSRTEEIIYLMDSADSSICSPSMGLLCMLGRAAVGLFAGASRKALLGIPIVSRLMDRDQ